MSQHHQKPLSDMEQLLQQFAEWTVHEDQSETGWESEFPGWLPLLHEADKLIQQVPLSQKELDQIAECWRISDETEDCADFARRHLQQEPVRQAVAQLTGYADEDVRWQAYDALGYVSVLDADTQRVLEKGLADENSYVRRRAFLALTKHPSVKMNEYFLQMMHDPSSYNRYVAVLVGQHLHDPTVEARARFLLESDPAVKQQWSEYLANKEYIDKSIGVIA